MGIARDGVTVAPAYNGVKCGGVAYNGVKIYPDLLEITIVAGKWIDGGSSYVGYNGNDIYTSLDPFGSIENEYTYESSELMSFILTSAGQLTFRFNGAKIVAFWNNLEIEDSGGNIYNTTRIRTGGGTDFIYELLGSDPYRTNYRTGTDIPTITEFETYTIRFSV